MAVCAARSWTSQSLCVPSNLEYSDSSLDGHPRQESSSQVAQTARCNCLKQNQRIPTQVSIKSSFLIYPLFPMQMPGKGRSVQNICLAYRSAQVALSLSARKSSWAEVKDGLQENFSNSNSKGNIYQWNLASLIIWARELLWTSVSFSKIKWATLLEEEIEIKEIRQTMQHQQTRTESTTQGIKIVEGRI